MGGPYVPSERMATALRELVNSGHIADPTTRTTNSLVAHGLIRVGSRAPWEITDEGRKALARAEYRARNREQREQRRSGA